MQKSENISSCFYNEQSHHKQTKTFGANITFHFDDIPNIHKYQIQQEETTVHIALCLMKKAFIIKQTDI